MHGLAVSFRLTSCGRKHGSEGEPDQRFGPFLQPLQLIDGTGCFAHQSLARRQAGVSQSARFWYFAGYTLYSKNGSLPARCSTGSATLNTGTPPAVVPLASPLWACPWNTTEAPK